MRLLPLLKKMMVIVIFSLLLVVVRGVLTGPLALDCYHQVKLTFGFWDKEMVEAFRIRDKADGKRMTTIVMMMVMMVMVVVIMVADFDEDPDDAKECDLDM